MPNMTKRTHHGGSPASSRVMKYNRAMVGGSTASSQVLQNLTADAVGGNCKMTIPQSASIDADPAKLGLYATTGGGSCGANRTNKMRGGAKNNHGNKMRGGGSSDFVSSFYAVEAGKVDPSSMHGPYNSTIQAYNSDPDLMGSTFAPAITPQAGGRRKTTRRKSKKSKSKGKK